MNDSPIEAITISVVGFEAVQIIAEMNRVLFDEDRIINRFDRPDLIMLLAMHEEEPVGFKVGYGLDGGVYYSAKGGVLAAYRRKGIASALLDDLMEHAAHRGYDRFAFDTFPNQHTGMTALAVKRGFIVTNVRQSDVYDDLRVRFSIGLSPDG